MKIEKVSENGKLTILPWDYNLAFGGFQSGSASAVVNEDIDAGAELTDRPMLHWIFTDEACTAEAEYRGCSGISGSQRPAVPR